jgi:hypothetical protein
MAGDWMALRLDIHDDPAVILISSLLKIEIDAVVGKLARLWAWANKHLADGTARVTSDWIDQHVSAAGFAAAMAEAGWLQVRSGSVHFPGFDVWNSAGAKKRLLDSKRKSRVRQESNPPNHANVRPVSALQTDKSGTREEKRREEKEERSLSPPAIASERENSEHDPTPNRRLDLTSSLMLPPLITEAMRAYSPEIQAEAWQITNAFTAYSPAKRSTQKLGEIAAAFADSILARPGARDKLKSYFSVTDPKQIEAEFVAGKRLRPGASPWEICDWLFLDEKPKQPRPSDDAAARERAKREAAAKDQLPPGALAKMRRDFSHTKAT